jgi:hypothetical protein
MLSARQLRCTCCCRGQRSACRASVASFALLFVGRRAAFGLHPSAGGATPVPRVSALVGPNCGSKVIFFSSIISRNPPESTATDQSRWDPTSYVQQGISAFLRRRRTARLVLNAHPSAASGFSVAPFCRRRGRDREGRGQRVLCFRRRAATHQPFHVPNLRWNSQCGRGSSPAAAPDLSLRCHIDGVQAGAVMMDSPVGCRC